jgi:hypothetical protein
MLNEQAKNVSIVIGGSLGLFVLLIGGFLVLCALSWALMSLMNWFFASLGLAHPFGNEQGPAGLEILIGAFLLLSLRRLTRIATPEE